MPGDVVGARRHFHGIGRKLLGGVAGGHMAMGAHAPLQVHGGPGKREADGEVQHGGGHVGRPVVARVAGEGVREVHELAAGDEREHGGVLHKVGGLHGQRRQDDAHGLGQDDERHGLHGREPLAFSRLELTAVHRADSAAHHL